MGSGVIKFVERFRVAFPRKRRYRYRTNDDPPPPHKSALTPPPRCNRLLGATKRGRRQRRHLSHHPQRPVPELRAEALAAQPPAESGQFRGVDLVELTKLDPTIKLDIRYATTNNFLSTPVYTQPRRTCRGPRPSALARPSRAGEPGLRTADSRCLSALVGHEGFLGSHAGTMREFVADPARARDTIVAAPSI